LAQRNFQKYDYIFFQIAICNYCFFLSQFFPEDVNIFIPEGAKLSMNTENGDEPSLKFPAERVKEWNDIGIHELLGI